MVNVDIPCMDGIDIGIDNDLTLQFFKGPSPHPMARSAQQSKPRKRKACTWHV